MILPSPVVAIRPRSVENVVEEIAYDRSLFPNLKEIMFEDDTLIMHATRDRLAQLCEAIVRRNFGLSWSANARVDMDDLEILELMKRSGCRMLCVGFEFGDQRVLDNVNKGTTDALRDQARLTPAFPVRIERGELERHAARSAAIR